MIPIWRLFLDGLVQPPTSNQLCSWQIPRHIPIPVQNLWLWEPKNHKHFDVQVYKMARSVFKELVQEKIVLNNCCNDVGIHLGPKSGCWVVQWLCCFCLGTLRRKKKCLQFLWANTASKQYVQPTIPSFHAKNARIGHAQNYPLMTRTSSHTPIGYVGMRWQRCYRDVTSVIRTESW